ncbi:MAG: YifB family Mg chelatase-like AAA ATPase [Treponema sp.]|nr:YifB family Mg chelatase-like AAA ATPase [Treponema sp.]
MQIYSFSPFGYEGALVTVEVDLRRGIPAIDIVGLADGAVKESKERMQAAIRNCDFDFPPERVLISLSPADMKKEGAGFDLPIAVGVLAANAEANGEKDFLSEPILIMGELELSGKIRPVKGIHAAVSTAASCGIMHCIVPAQNADEAREVTGVQVYGADNLINAFRAIKDRSFFESRNSSKESSYIPPDCVEVDGVYFSSISPGYEFAELKDQAQLVRSLQIAAAGGHNLIALGAPGCGKTMAIQKFPAITPLLTLEEAQSVTRIWSLAGLIKPSEPLVRIPPFRIPHQTATLEGICGGGPNCRPGEISLAHNGILFLDEAAEFRSSVLQMLRVPLESGSITLSRAGRSTNYPANFQLLMAVNPCPCGNFGSKTKICLCSAKSVEQYWKKFSAPLLDRVDLRIFVENKSDGKDIEERKGLKTTAEIRQGVARAIKIQRNRQGIRNSKLNPQEILEICKIDEDSQTLLDKAVNRYGFSPRAIASCLKVSRTIADIEGSQDISPKHMAEAISLRKLCCNMIPEIA